VTRGLTTFLKRPMKSSSRPEATHILFRNGVNTLGTLQKSGRLSGCREVASQLFAIRQHIFRHRKSSWTGFYQNSEPSHPICLRYMLAQWVCRRDPLLRRLDRICGKGPPACLGQGVRTSQRRVADFGKQSVRPKGEGALSAALNADRKANW
jgi:hypothetical protein